MDEPHHYSQLEKAARLIESARMLLIVTGAGMGVDSGLPDFRGNKGFWRAYPALERSGIDFVSIASPRAFRQHPEMAWGFYGHRLNLYRQTAPHRGFDILRKWGEARSGGYMVFTTNVDGHFQKAGFDPNRIMECHGSIHYLQCMDACTDDIWPADDFVPVVDEVHCLLLSDLPRCPHCGGLARPNICMFGDYEWQERRAVEQQQRLERWLHGADRLIIIEIGAGTAISTARDFTQRMAHSLHAPAIRINPQEADIRGNPDHVSLAMGGLEALVGIEVMGNEKLSHKKRD